MVEDFESSIKDNAEVCLNIKQLLFIDYCHSCAYMTGRVKFYVNTALELTSRCILQLEGEERERERERERL